MNEDIYGRVTDQIISALESAALGKWSMPWTQSNAGMPTNVTNGKHYRGVNTLALWAASQCKGYSSAAWGTYKQWTDKGAQVRKGEKSSTVVFWKFSERTTESQDGEDIRSTAVFARGYSVFNASQVDGWVAPSADVLPVSTIERIPSADIFFQSIGGNVQHGGNRAFYAPGDDRIQLPAFESFHDAVSYYSTFAHEYTHWTAPAARCDRQLGKRFGDNAYAAEELIAELGAAFVCAHLGLSTEPREDHAQYLSHWLGILRADKRAIFTAASKAQQAADYLVGRAA